eukprot:SAG22_NODE_331_length_12174_cov_12.920497_10_plen_259_part_00
MPLARPLLLPRSVALQLLMFSGAVAASGSGGSGCSGGGGSGAWPEVGEHQAFAPPAFSAVSTGASNGNVRARLCVADDADAVVATIPWRQRVLIEACPPPPAPNPPPTPSDPCHWLVYEGGFNSSNIAGPSGNIQCGSELAPLKAACCKNAKCVSVSWIASMEDGCCKPNDLGGWSPHSGAFSYVKVKEEQVKAKEVQQTKAKEAEAARPLCVPRIIIRSAVTGLEVANVVITNATREAGTVVFEPEFGPGEYHAYCE